MRKMITRLAACFALTAAASTQALPIVQADAFAVGDNKAALETSTGLVWMDFGVNSTYHNPVSILTVADNLETLYPGWRLPTESEVRHLWHNLFGNLAVYYNHWSEGTPSEVYSLSDWDNNEQQTFQEISNIFGSYQTWVGINRYGVEGGSDDFIAHYSLGHFFTDAGNIGEILFWTPIQGVHTSVATLYLNSDASDPLFVSGTLLVKSNKVPEPSSLMLLSFGLLGLGFARRTAK